MKKQLTTDLEGSITFFVKVLYNELDHDQELSTEYRSHLKNLTRVHSFLEATEVDEE